MLPRGTSSMSPSWNRSNEHIAESRWLFCSLLSNTLAWGMDFSQMFYFLTVPSCESYVFCSQTSHQGKLPPEQKYIPHSCFHQRNQVFLNHLQSKMCSDKIVTSRTDKFKGHNVWCKRHRWMLFVEAKASSASWTSLYIVWWYALIRYKVFDIEKWNGLRLRKKWAVMNLSSMYAQY